MKEFCDKLMTFGNYVKVILASNKTNKENLTNNKDNNTRIVGTYQFN